MITAAAIKAHLDWMASFGQAEYVRQARKDYARIVGEYLREPAMEARP